LKETQTASSFICKRKSHIPTFEHAGLTLSDEEAKADAIYDYFNGILGTYFARTRNIDLAQIGLPQLDLSALEAPFSTDEVWNIIKSIPNDRAPGPDGFTGRFYKAAWPIIKEDVVAVFNAFWDLDRQSFHTLNTANMVLLRKTSAPTHLKEYRPISLVHSIGKLVAKALSARLAPHLSALIQQNQSTFIRGRSIHDNFMSVQLACRWLHSRHCPAILLKIDIAKAFDLVSWEFLLQLPSHMGFPLRWREWITILLSSASTRVLMNGRP
jgi:hypothetical protein